MRKIVVLPGAALAAAGAETTLEIATGAREVLAAAIQGWTEWQPWPPSTG